MKYILLMLCIFCLTEMPAYAERKSFTLSSEYLRPDGAIMSLPGSKDVVDPYFPTRALLLAHDSGLDISTLGMRWVNWMLPRQEQNGLFPRFCLTQDHSSYQVCGSADADDAMMAIWIELLYRLSPSTGLPLSWQKSIQKAEAELQMLYNEKLDIYHISKTIPVGLLMDNIEIHHAFKNAAKDALRIGDKKQADKFYEQASRLERGIIKTFWDSHSKRFMASTQTRQEKSFYPDTIVQLVPMMYQIYMPFIKAHSRFYKMWMNRYYRLWMIKHQAEWFSLLGREYPWGILAIFALQQRDYMTANCWLERSLPYRHGRFWDVLDEAAFQSIEWKLQKKWPKGRPACTSIRYCTGAK